MEIDFKKFIEKIDKDLKLIVEKQPKLITKETKNRWRRIKQLNFQNPKNVESFVKFYELVVLANLSKVR